MIQKQPVFLLFIILPILFLSGCAKQHWTKTLEEEETTGIAQIIYDLQKEDDNCPTSFDAEALLFLETPVESKATQGYLQIKSPSYLKLVISNPLGQPIYIISSNGRTFQSLDMTIRRHIRGSVRSLGIRNNIPLIIMNGDWYAFLSGTLPSQPFTIDQIHRNAEDQSVWVALPKKASLTGTLEHTYLHFDPVQQKVLGYLFLDDKGETLANIFYGDQEENGEICTVQKQIHITELPWDTKIRVELKDTNSNILLQKKDFVLPVPKDYSKQLHP